MADRDALAATLAELRRLGGRDRRAILAALEPAERARVEALLRAPDEAVPPAPHDEAPAFSPWLAERLDANDLRITPATRRALAEAMRDAGEAHADTLAAAPRGRSLLGALLGRGAAAR